MDKLTFYRKAMREVLYEHSHKPSHGTIDVEIVIDADQNHFELMFVGWDGARRVHGAVLHMDLIDEKIWIQHDGTAPGVALDLVAKGVPREDIVLGFRPAHVRPYTDFGTGETAKMIVEA